MSRSIYDRPSRSFVAYNQRRKERALEIDPERSAVAFTIIPWLLHINHADFPGFVPGATTEPLGGLHRYSLDENVERTLLDHFSSSDIAKVEESRGQPTILSLLLMGSIGTAAQTRESDFDYWVVVDESNITPGARARLTQKLTAIEGWAATKRMEVHFFLCDVEKTRNNDFGATDKESAGSSQKFILKEEFYRTMILVAGQTPIWWLFEAGLTGDDYLDAVEDMELEGYLDFHDYVDLGPVEPIPVGELFGALLWQFNKAMANPYKSALKMAFLESLIVGGEGKELLADRLKTMVHQSGGETDVDPYLLMFETSEASYGKMVNKKELDLLRTCFFIKLFDKPVSESRDRESLPFKERSVRMMIRRWGWNADRLTDMNNFLQWDFRKLTELAGALHRSMIETYKRLTDRVTETPHVNNVISQGDLGVLGRKLYTLYSTKQKEKIEYMKRVKNEWTELDTFSFAMEPRRSGGDVWKLYRDNIISSLKKGHGVEHLLLRQNSHPAALLMWLVQNRVARPNSFLNLVASKSPLALADLQQLMDLIFALFPPSDLSTLDPDDLKKQAHIEKIILGINITSERWERKIVRVTLLCNNSWGESFCYDLPAAEGVATLGSLMKNTHSGFAINDSNRFEIFIPKSDVYGPLKRATDTLLAKKFYVAPVRG